MANGEIWFIEGNLPNQGWQIATDRQTREQCEATIKKWRADPNENLRTKEYRIARYTRAEVYEVPEPIDPNTLSTVEIDGAPFKCEAPVAALLHAVSEERDNLKLDLQILHAELKEQRQEVSELNEALKSSVSLQSHYAALLNIWDGGTRLQFKGVQEWRARVRQVSELEKVVKY